MWLILALCGHSPRPLQRTLLALHWTLLGVHRANPLPVCALLQLLALLLLALLLLGLLLALLMLLPFAVCLQAPALSGGISEEARGNELVRLRGDPAPHTEDCVKYELARTRLLFILLSTTTSSPNALNLASLARMTGTPCLPGRAAPGLHRAGPSALYHALLGQVFHDVPGEHLCSGEMSGRGTGWEGNAWQLQKACMSRHGLEHVHVHACMCACQPS